MSGFHRLHTLRMENDAAGFALDEMRPRFERLAGRHENGTAPRALSVYQLFQTPPGVAQRLAAALDMAAGGRILEPSAGLGRLLDAVAPLMPAEIVAVELNAGCAGELFRQDRAGVTIKQRDFLTVTPDEIGLFDGVIMNPPFHMRDDIKHILHARKFLKPGGRLAAICMDGPHRREQLRPLCSSWTNLPPKTFKETGTNINAALIVLNADCNRATR